MVRASTPGRTEECMKETISMTRNMALVSTHGLMGANTTVCGKMESKMARANTFCLRACKEEDTGGMVSVKNGSMLPVSSKPPEPLQDKTQVAI